jgi:hypothetical protein
MKRVMRLALLVGGVTVFFRRLPLEWRENLSQLPGTTMGWLVDHMPDE